MIVDHLPAASDIDHDRAKKLMCSATQRFSSLPTATQELCECYMKCDSVNAPLIVYISKVIDSLLKLELFIEDMI